MIKMISRLTLAVSDRKDVEHSMETHRATFIQYQTLPAMGISLVHPACEGYFRLHTKNALV